MNEEEEEEKEEEEEEKMRREEEEEKISPLKIEILDPPLILAAQGATRRSALVCLGSPCRAR